MQIGRLQKVPLREIWRNEARDFTNWLADNLDLLGEVLGVNLTLVKREASAGTFSADILAEDGSGVPVIIENQLEATDHAHLGQLMTYLSNLQAKTAVWISSQPRPEHEAAIHWLNQYLPADVAFYLLKVEAYRIGTSEPAPAFTIVAGPTTEGKQIGEQKEELAERHVLRLEFWGQLLKKARQQTQLHAAVSPGKENWISAGAGKSGLGFNYAIRMSDAQVELYIDRGDGEDNKRIFDQLLAQREVVERDFGGPLDWQRLDDRRASRIRYVLPGGGLTSRDRWPMIQDAMIEAMVRLERAVKPAIKRLKEAS